MRFSFKYWIIVVLCVMINITACNKLEKPETETEIPSTESPSYEEQEIPTENPEIIISENEEKESYSSALTQEEIEDVEDLAREYYETSFPYPLVSIELADDNHTSYRHYSEYTPGNIIIFNVKTTYEKDDSLYRTIIFGRDGSDDKWEFLNEGY